MSSRKAAGTAKIVRAGDPGRTSSKGHGVLVFTAPGEATPEQVSAVERAGGKVKAPAKVSAEPAAE